MTSLYQSAVLILSRAVIFPFVQYNAPVRAWAIVKFAKVNESPILYEAKCFMITKIGFWEIARRVYVSILLRGTYFTPRNEDFEQNATVRV